MRFESYNAHYYQMKLSHQSALKSDATVRTTARTPKVGSKGTTTSLHQPAKNAKKSRFIVIWTVCLFCRGTGKPNRGYNLCEEALKNYCVHPKLGSKGTTTSLHQPAKDTKKSRFISTWIVCLIGE